MISRLRLSLLPHSACYKHQAPTPGTLTLGHTLEQDRIFCRRDMLQTLILLFDYKTYSAEDGVGILLPEAIIRHSLQFLGFVSTVCQVAAKHRGNKYTNCFKRLKVEG